MKRTRIALTSAVLFGVVPGCYDNVGTTFEDTGIVRYPDGSLAADLSPFETPNLATLPPATATDPCPEMLVKVQGPDFATATSVHAAACVHADLASVWEAIQDPEVAHDAGSTTAFSVIQPPMPSECDGVYESQLQAMQLGVTIDFRLCWRLGVAAGTAEDPTLVRARWQKVWGSAAIMRLEGSVEARALDDAHPDITAVFYQYHLKSASIGPSNLETINNYLDLIYSRLVTRSHGTQL
ncbi:MAG: hypothetical protein U0234_26340 [Sandaracinus sp.]